MASKSDFWGGLAATFVAVVLAPFLGMIGSLIDRSVWRMFLSEYGDGPSLRAWFGIGLLISLALYSIKRQAEKGDQSWVSFIIGAVLGAMLWQGIILIVASWTCLVWGWT